MTSAARNVSYERHPLPLEAFAITGSAADAKIDDFVSFPTLPDTEVVADRSLSTFITKTLRKVTNNASNLVHNYTSANAGTEPNVLQILDSLSVASHRRLSETLAEMPAHEPVCLGGSFSTITPLKSHPKSPHKSSIHDMAGSNPSLASAALNLIPVSTAPPVVSTHASEVDFGVTPQATETEPPLNNVPRAATDNLPRVTSDNLFLKLSMPGTTRASMAQLSTSEVTVGVNSEPEIATVTNSTNAHVPGTKNGPIKLSKTRVDPATEASTVKTLQNRILSIFNNLPNDIEVSDDDSASDLDTEEHETSNSSLPNVEIAGMSLLSQLRPPKPPDFRIHSAHSGQKCLGTAGTDILATTPVKASPAKPRHASRRMSNHFPLAIIDGAKSIILTNLVGVSSSTSSIMDSVKGKRGRKKTKAKKKTRKPHALSNNPLKNGGIPKKYWMDDSFVSDCLNCFKQFTAFRRKHHCRFCGQIFCADCTIFISYSQYKQQRHGSRNERKNGAKMGGEIGGKLATSYKDKLRVCKPCYSDVVVYLSDDSLSSSSSEEEEHPKKADDPQADNKAVSAAAIEEDLDNDATGVPEHIATRLRTYSASSVRSSVVSNPSPVLKLNRNPVFSSKESPFLKTASPQMPEASLVNTNNISGNNTGSSNAQRSPELTHRHPPKMAIPTRRTGEAVEIAILSDSYTQSSSLNTHQTLRSYGHGIFSLNVVGSELPDATSWYRHYPRRPASVSSEIDSGAEPVSRTGTFSGPLSGLKGSLAGNLAGNLSGLENISLFYKSVVNGKYARLPTKSKLDFSKRAQDSNSRARGDTKHQDEEDVEDVESETEEDEKVMSLYTSLNRLAAGADGGSGAKMNHFSGPFSGPISGVPTLLEFPGVEGKYGPANMSQSNAMSRFEFKPIDSVNNSKMTESRQRSNLRSNERAKASLQRIKDRRNQRPVKKTRGRGVSAVIPSMQYSPNTDAAASGLLPKNPFGATPFPAQNAADSYPDTALDTAHSQSSSPYRDAKSNISGVSATTHAPKSVAECPQASLHGHALLGAEVPLTMENTSESVEKPPKTPLLAMFDRRLKQMITQCLEDCDLKDKAEQERWVRVLLQTFANIHRIKVGDTLDVKQYVKIKKILGGKLADTCVFDGLFITKDVDSKRMSSLTLDPKIALLVFPLEYLKHKEQFISLRVVKSQQAVYISNLVSRLISLGPDIVVVGDTVCGLAEKLLEEAGITVLSNVKPQVIERISRYTKADIFQSVNDLFLKKGSLGKCDRFEVKKFVFGDMVKTYSFFLGSDVEFGFTVCLRGGDEEYLSSVKYASETLIPGAFNSRFELSFFQDFALNVDPEGVVETRKRYWLQTLEKLVNGDADTVNTADMNDSNDAKTACAKAMDHYGVFNYVKLFSERNLSFSPSVCYPLPSTLANVVEAFQSLVRFYDLDKKIQGLTESEKIDLQWLDQMGFQFDLDRFNGIKDILTALKFVSTESIHVHQTEFNVRLRIWANSMKNSVYQLYPIFHRSIHFLHSRVSIKHATPCYGPVVVVVDFYSDNDKSLGTFLDQTLQETGKTCDECGDLLLNHYKTYAHGNHKIDLIVEKVEADSQVQEQFKDHNSRIMWIYCPACNVSSPITLMSSETYFLSLGKFFELNFWSRHAWHENLCEHDFFRGQVKYFGMRGFFIRIESSEITTYEVVVPRKQLEFVASLNLELKLSALKTIQESSSRFFKSISNRLNRIKVDTFEKAEGGHQKIEKLKMKVQKDEEFIASKTLGIYGNTLPTNYMSLNVVQRDIQELGVAWDKEFNEFERQFLPTENEITKITQLHLRNFLMDRLDTELKEQCAGADVSKSVQRARDLEPDAKSDPQSAGLAPVQELEGTGYSHTKFSNDDIFSVDARRVPLTIIEDKIMQIRQSLEGGHHRHLLKLPQKHKADADADACMLESGIQPLHQLQAPKRVQDLTNYFNQMTLEFQKQREAVLERQSSKYKAIPIVRSQPIVEIYDNIEDVVEVDRQAPVPSKNMQGNDEQSKVRPGKNQRNPQDPPNSQNSQNQPRQENNDPFYEDRDRKALTVSLEQAKDSREIVQPEKNSLLKSLSNFWADRLATLWDPLEYPLDFTEHTFADSEVIVREDEPCSLVAFCLSTSDYKQKITGMGSSEAAVVVAEDKASETMEISEQLKKKNEHFAKLERKFKKKRERNKSGNSGLELIMNKSKSSHLKYQFVDGSTEMSCKIFYSEQFEALRNACGVDESFIQSLSRCVKWDTKGGKSGSNFLKTLDNRYIIKELSKSELESFVSIAPFYFKYISQSTFNTLTTALAKIFGFYQVEFKNSMNGKVFRMDFLIMENLFYNRKTTRIFDLKGSMRNRHVKQTGKENEVLLDENMIEYIYESPVFVKEQLKKLLRGSLFNDTSFLSAMDVMDYSLVIGIDDASGKLYIGIIDWLRTFTWDKKVENWVKGKSLVGKKGKDPTIVTPKQYRTRFREAMDRYILEVPDIWYEGSS